jgi:serine/threonine-protein kinase
VSDRLATRAFVLFRAALERPEEARAAFLDAECGTDAELRRRVEALCRADRTGPALLDLTPSRIAAALATGAETQEKRLEGRRIGPYRLVREVGRGGMGVVLLAERDDVGSRVAVKLLRGALGAPEHERRFRRERRFLARLQHPHIARLLDAGILPDGTPWYAMDYVEGEPIDRFCDARRLAVAERLALFSKVLAAVSHAHRNLVIHRDIKPANILVRPDGEPTLLDFGIAKLIGDDDQDAPTRSGAYLMTPEYAAPEQLRGEAVTTATDVFALGAVLYELLTGRRARRSSGRSLAELGKLALDTGPKRPSDAIGRAGGGSEGADGAATATAVAAARSTDPPRLRRRLRGELDAITLAALAPNPTDRYPSADARAADLEAYRAGRPVAARPATWRYRAHRFLVRNAVVATAVAALFVAVVGLSIVYTYRVTQERDLARAESERATQVAGFLMDLFAAADPTDVSGRAQSAEDLLDRGFARIGTELTDQPEVQVALLEELHEVYQELDRYEESERAAREALRLRRAFGIGGPAELLGAELEAGWALFWLGRHGEARELVDSSMARHRRSEGGDDPALAESWALLGAIATRLGDLDEAERAYLEAMRLQRTIVADTAPIMLTTRNNFGHTLLAQGRYAEAEALYRDVYEVRARTLGRGQTQTQTSLANLARAVRETGRWEEAEALAREVLELRRLAYAPDHLRIGLAQREWAVVLMDLGRAERALSLLEEARAIVEGSVGADHVETVRSLTPLGEALTVNGRTDSAAVVLERAVSTARRSLGAGHPEHARALTALAENELLRGDTASAERGLHEAEAILRAALGEDHPELAVTLESLARVLADRDPRAAGDALSRAHAIRVRRLGDMHPLTQRTRASLRAVRERRGR